MKTNTYIKLLLTGFLLGFVLAAFAITDEEIVIGLEALDDWEAAYPLALQIAREQNAYPVWREVAIKYSQFDSDNRAYLQAWQQAYLLNQESTYRDFLNIKPQSSLNHYAISAIFKLIRASDKFEGYLRFIAEFSNVVESIEALLKTHEIAFQRAKNFNEPLVFDAFVMTFYGAKQIPQAIELAFETEKQRIEKELSDIDNIELREKIARRLFSEGRIAEKQHAPLVAARKYQLLNLDIFIDTKVFTALLDKKERFAYQKLMQTKQNEIAKSINEMRDAIIETIQLKTQLMEPAMVKELPAQNPSLEKIIARHNYLLVQQFKQLNKNIKAGSHIDTNVAELIPVLTGLKIAKVIGKISLIITKTLANPSKYQAILFGSKNN